MDEDEFIFLHDDHLSDVATTHNNNKPRMSVDLLIRPAHFLCDTFSKRLSTDVNGVEGDFVFLFTVIRD
jgi:hypothetical protein